MAGDQALALIAAAMAALKADPAVAGFVGDRIYDNVPAFVLWPYLTIGESSSHAVFGSADYEADDVFFDVHVWSRHVNGTSTEAHRIRSAVGAALHTAGLNLGSSAALARIVRTTSRMFRDPDNLTWHGVVSFEARVEANEE